MRNAPLIAALSFYKKLYPELKIFTCIDERGASYRALGYTKATGTPSVLLCTSGTALANYYPAVIEAYKSNLPLVVISADRPKEQILSGDNQTINQNNIYSEFLKAELDLGIPSIEVSPRDLATNISNLISKAVLYEQGPIHLNCPFREPLENTLQEVAKNYIVAANDLVNTNYPATDYLKTSTILATQELNYLANLITKPGAGILIIGSLPPSCNLEPIRNFIKALGWPVYLDVSSSLKYEYSLHEGAIPTFDHPEVLSEFIANPPETILHVGGRLTSKHYYSFLSSLPLSNLITINNNSNKEDPSHHTKIRINADINPILNALTNLLGPQKRAECSPLDFKKFVDNKRKIIEDGPLSYPIISKQVIESLPDNSTIYIANSTVVRSFDSYCSLSGAKRLTVATNRGVSGIEGFIASSCGFIDGNDKDIYLIIGDVSFMHDLNSLYFLKTLQHKLKIILINNYGGGIFTLLPIHKEEEVISYITSPHQENFEKIASNFNLQYTKVNEVSELSSAISNLQNFDGHAILEIFVDHQINKNVYDQLRTIKIS